MQSLESTVRDHGRRHGVNSELGYDLSWNSLKRNATAGPEFQDEHLRHVSLLRGPSR